VLHPYEPGMSSIAVTRRARLRTGIAYALALIIIAAGVSALWYRAYYNIWPGQGAAARVHWCERNYQKGGPPQTWHQITAGTSFPVRAVGEYPPLGLTRRELFAPIVPHAQPSSCATVVYVRAGPGKYQSYVLLGGP
jgi:hypothetical protein